MNQEILIFKEEILKEIHDFEVKLMKNFDENLNDLRKKNDYFEENIKYILESNRKLLNTVTSSQSNNDKIKDLETFKNKVDSMLITHEIRINNNIDEIGSIRMKYDKALIDNLLVPGYIGPTSKYKSIGDYIIHNISDIAKIKSEKDVMKSMFKDMKTKNDSLMKNILNLTESSVKRCNDYTNVQISDIKKLIYDKVKIIEEKEQEIKDIIKKNDEEKNSSNNSDRIKEDIMTILDTKLSEAKKNQDEFIFNEINKNNTFIENYTKNIFEEKIKYFEEKIKNIENKISKLKLFNRPTDTSTYKTTNITEEKLNKNNSIQNLRKGKTNEFSDINSYIPNKTFTNAKTMSAINKNMVKKNLEVQKNNNCEKSLETILIEEIEKDNKRKKEEKEIPDIVLKHKEAKLLFLKNNQNQIYKNNIHEIKSGKPKNSLNINTIKKKEGPSGCSESFSFVQKNGNIEEENNKNSDINGKLENYYSHIKNKISNKSLELIENNINNETKTQNDKNKIGNKIYHLITDENEENAHINYQNNTKNITNNENNNIIPEKTHTKKSYEKKQIRNIIDDLKIPRILEKRILSKDELEEIKLNTEKIRNLNNKTNFKKSHYKVSSASYKTMPKNNNNIYLSPKTNNQTQRWKKNLMNKKMDIKSERYVNNDGYYMVNLELGQNNYTANGATVLANKKLLNNHITKIENGNSFSKLFNAQLAKNIFHNNEN